MVFTGVALYLWHLHLRFLKLHGVAPAGPGSGTQCPQCPWLSPLGRHRGLRGAACAACRTLADEAGFNERVFTDRFIICVRSLQVKTD